MVADGNNLVVVVDNLEAADQLEDHSIGVGLVAWVGQLAVVVVAVVLDTPAVVETHHKIRHRRSLLSKTG